MRPQRVEEPLVGGIAVLEHDEGFRLGEPVAGLLADDRGLAPGLGRGEPRLYLERGHPHAVDLEHVVGAPAVIIVPLGVAQVLVAGIGPFADEGAAALGAVVPVAFTRGGPAHHELANLSRGKLASALVNDLYLVPRHRLAGRSVAPLDPAVAPEGLQP